MTKIPEFQASAVIKGEDLIDTIVSEWTREEVLAFILELDLTMGENDWTLMLISKLRDQTDMPDNDTDINDLRERVDQLVDVVAELKAAVYG